MNIDEMKAGPELDGLACGALGIESVPVVRWRCRICKSFGCSETIRHRDRFWELAETGQRSYPAVSTDPAAMVAVKERSRDFRFRITKLLGALWQLEIWPEHGEVISAAGETAMEAFARAAAKTKEG